MSASGPPRQLWLGAGLNFCTAAKDCFVRHLTVIPGMLLCDQSCHWPSYGAAPYSARSQLKIDFNVLDAEGQQRTFERFLALLQV